MASRTSESKPSTCGVGTGGTGPSQEQANNAIQILGPILQAWLQETGDVGPLNNLLKFWGKAMDYDNIDEMLIQPPPPQPPQPDPAQQQAEAELQLKQAEAQQRMGQAQEAHQQQMVMDFQGHQQEMATGAAKNRLNLLDGLTRIGIAKELANVKKKAKPSANGK